MYFGVKNNFSTLNVNKILFIIGRYLKEHAFGFKDYSLLHVVINI
jgi:hypothetical protein